MLKIKDDQLARIRSMLTPEQAVGYTQIVAQQEKKAKEQDARDRRIEEQRAFERQHTGSKRAGDQVTEPRRNYPTILLHGLLLASEAAFFCAAISRAFAYFFWKRSTRPSVSISFCRPVKNGWQLEQISTRISPLCVDRVLNDDPHAHTTFTSS